MADRNIEDLSPTMRSKCIAWIKAMQAVGIQFIIVCTLRSQAEQDVLWALGRSLVNGVWVITDPKKVVTWTQHSKHLTGDAFDFVIMFNGKPDWRMVHMDLWNKAIGIGKNLGLSQVIGKDGRVKEFAHLQEM
jgi:peptidoglycan L-alanyl-D-glutamate endopeptidase CwlK